MRFVCLVSALALATMAGCTVPRSDSQPEPGADGSSGPTPGEPEPGEPAPTPVGAGPDLLTACDSDFSIPLGASCEVTSGRLDALLIVGDLLTADGVIEHGQLAIENGAITCMACDCRSSVTTPTILNCGRSSVSPGLINPHEHLTFSANPPVQHGTERYDHRHEWRRGRNGKTRLRAPSNRNASNDAWGEMRHVMAGTTSIVGAGAGEGFARNLDRNDELGGIAGEAVNSETFPLNDQSTAQLIDSGCGSYDIDPAGVLDDVYIPHVAEGIGAAARNEFTCLSSSLGGGRDLMEEGSSWVHGLGMQTADIAQFAGERLGLVWSPRSNTDLYGVTAAAPTYDLYGVNISLGTDWSATGSVNMLRELACADQWNTSYWNDYFTDRQLVDMVTLNPAIQVGFDDSIGLLEVGRLGDIAIWRRNGKAPYAAIVEASINDTLLVMRAGLPLYGTRELVGSVSPRSECESFDVCGETRAICVARELGMSLDALRADLNENTYGLFFCGVPDNEPSCEPFRPNEFDGAATADDSDGDGIDNALDNCPMMFNPVLPLDDGFQPDADGDGLGDLCDPCPLNADTASCLSIRPSDRDSDGVDDESDNCVDVPNRGQTDLDFDGIGDACDICPDVAQSPGVPCLTTPYLIKANPSAEGTEIQIEDVLVTAVGPQEYFVTVDPVGTDWQGEDFAAIYVYAPDGNHPAVGDRVTITGQAGEFFDLIQIENSSFVVSEASAGVPPPIAVTAAEIAPNGARAAALEGALVTIASATVEQVGRDGEGNTEGEYVLVGGLVGDDRIYDIAPQASEVFERITGVLFYSFGQNKLLPRSASDVERL